MLSCFCVQRKRAHSKNRGEFIYLLFLAHFHILFYYYYYFMLFYLFILFIYLFESVSNNIKQIAKQTYNFFKGKRISNTYCLFSKHDAGDVLRLDASFFKNILFVSFVQWLSELHFHTFPAP